MLPTLTQLRAEIDRLHTVLGEIESPVIFAHNDLLLGNILVDEETDTVRFIDYEYAAYNYQAYDIGNHFAEFAGSSPHFKLNILNVCVVRDTRRAKLANRDLRV